MKFGIRRPDGQWYCGQDDRGHRWGPPQRAGAWTTQEHVDVALRALQGALGPIADLPFEVDELYSARLDWGEAGPTGNPYEPDFSALELTVIGSAGVSLGVAPCPFEENADGATLWLKLHDGPLAIALTPNQARGLVEQLLQTVGAAAR